MAWVVEPGVEVIYSMTDASGHRSTMSVYMDSDETDPSAGGPLAVGNALQGISADGLVTIACRIRAAESAPAAATDGPYARGADKAKLVFSGADGSAVIMEVGSPNEVILQSDKINVNKVQAAVAALKTAMVNNAVTAEGQLITGLTYGYRRRPPRRKGL